MMVRSLVVIMALGCSGPAATTSTAPTVVADPEPTTEPATAVTEPPPADPRPPAPMTDEELKAIEPAPPVRGTPSSQAAIATKLNSEGARLMVAKQYAEASTKFRDAFARVPDGAYAFNLCRSLYQEGKFSEAKAACTAVAKLSPSATLEAQASAMIERLENEARAQSIVLP